MANRMDATDGSPAAQPAGVRKTSRTTHAQAGDRLRERVSAALAPLTALYELFDHRLRETPAADPAPLGWRPHIEAIRALLNGSVHGDRERLWLLMTDPAALAPARAPGAAESTLDPHTPQSVQAALEGGPVHLLYAPESTDVATVVQRIARQRIAAEERTLVLAPAEETLDRIIARIADDQGIRAVRVEERGHGDHGRHGPKEPRSAATCTTGVIRAVGTAYQQAWSRELARLRRELLWLEQWPRDRMALAAVRTQHERLRAELSAEEERLIERIRDRRAAITTAEHDAEAAQAARDRLEQDRQPIAEAAAQARTEWQERQQIADQAVQAAREQVRVTDEAKARCREREERHTRCGAELRAEHEREATLREELARAKEELPGAVAETERLSAVATEAEAAGHASYYRLAAAESALAAERRKLNWGQRLRIIAAGPEVKRLRRQVAACGREAGEAATAARRARNALEEAEKQRNRLATFLDGGDDQLASLRAAQDRLSAELERAAAEWEAAQAEYRQHSERVPELVEAAAQAEEAAAQACRRSAQAEERLNVADRALAQAAAQADRAIAQAQVAVDQLAEAQAELARHRDRTTAEIATGIAEIKAAQQTLEHAHRHVQEICGADPATMSEDVLHDRRTQAMARIERICDHLELLGDPAPADPNGHVGPGDDKPGAQSPGNPMGPTGTRALPAMAGPPGHSDDLPAPAEPDSVEGTAQAARTAEAEAVQNTRRPESTESTGNAAGEHDEGPGSPDPLDELGGVLLETAGLVCATAIGVAACPLLETTRFDTLIVADAGRITDGDFLIGAVRARRWVLIGADDEHPAGAAEELQDHVHALAALRAADESPDADPGATVEPDIGKERFPARRLPQIRAEAGRLGSEGLWRSRYRGAYLQALRTATGPPWGTGVKAQVRDEARNEADGRIHDSAGAGAAPADLDEAERLLLDAMTTRLEHSVFERCSAAAPGLRVRVVSAAQGEPA